MTYYQSPTAIHLALKPEKKHELLENFKLVPQGKKTLVACVNCGEVAGKEVPIGPDGIRVISFGVDKVTYEVARDFYLILEKHTFCCSDVSQHIFHFLFFRPFSELVTFLDI